MQRSVVGWSPLKSLSGRKNVLTCASGCGRGGRLQEVIFNHLPWAFIPSARLAARPMVKRRRALHKYTGHAAADRRAVAGGDLGLMH